MLGRALELIAKTTLSVSQIYRDVQIGPNPMEYNLNLEMPNILRDYQSVINETYI